MLILASSSPTRSKMLEKHGIKFTQQSVDFDEDSIVAGSPREFVYVATKGKLQAAIKAINTDKPILCADTVVSVDGGILRKAKNEMDAKRLLLLQSGSNVDIITCTMLHSSHMSYIDISTTRYKFDYFGSTDLNTYLDSGDWIGKAGAIMVEGFAKKYIKSCKGYESTAMGLCVEKLLAFYR